MTPKPPPITVEERRERIARAQRLMVEEGLDAILLPAGTSLRYFTGVRWGLSERLLAAVLPREGEPVYLAPAFEEPKLRGLLSIGDEVRLWQEDESAYTLAAGLLSEWNAARVGLDEATPYAFVCDLATAAPAIEWTDAAPVVSGCRQRKSPAEVALIRWAMELTLGVHRRVHATLSAGMTNTEIVQAIDRLHREGGADGGSTFAIVAFGDQTAYPHGPDGEQRLAEGETVLVDTGCTVEGYHSDLTRTYVYGKPTARQRELWEIEQAAQRAAFEAVRPGVACGAIDDAARAVLERHGLGPGYQTPGCPHRTGHGLGMDIHERPFLVRGNATPLGPGVVASLEPMIVAYGEMGIRLEDHFVVTEDGAQWLTEPSPSLDEPF
ncbi:putative peptidase [Planctomycetes bacterium MalM25]|nr:putative peptidase [Planctomycetes bacterium MalM25]